MLKELIKYLKEKHGVTYVSIMKRLDISREKMNFLTKNDVFQTRPQKHNHKINKNNCNKKNFLV